MPTVRCYCEECKYIDYAGYCDANMISVSDYGTCETYEEDDEEADHETQSNE